MKIVILCLGTSGDVDPLLSLGKVLQVNDHTVTLCGTDNCTGWMSEDHDLPLDPLGFDFKTRLLIIVVYFQNVPLSQSGEKSSLKKEFFCLL